MPDFIPLQLGALMTCDLIDQAKHATQSGFLASLLHVDKHAIGQIKDLQRAWRRCLRQQMSFSIILKSNAHVQGTDLRTPGP